ncbi:MAG: DUF2793 domain-containing protein [Phaeovulum sp.]|uniref:DUF2793 domain-containing protein n=1 Tax=Phaeovulum sp. TaxID=2934796 RepID=UPI0027304EAE|nr:DUF2793 domain-containing protein [Phaeovulum sp.]MDP2061926.1 DUF2793 domain-containing protein [Phaeovulum sp.]
MVETTRMALPLLQPAQAQKHVTVNEALMRLDGLVNLVLESRSIALPPTTVPNGQCFGVPLGAVNAWAGQGGRVAIGTNGGWVFVAPQFGWRAFIADEGRSALHDGTDWAAGALTLSPHGAGLLAGVSEIDHVIGAVATSTTEAIIPGQAMVIGVSARVVSAITGTLTSWQLGNVGAPDRFGSGLGIAEESWARGMLSQPMTFWSPEPLLLSATGGNFAGGVVRLAVHYLEISLPSV